MSPFRSFLLTTTSVAALAVTLVACQHQPSPAVEVDSPEPEPVAFDVCEMDRAVAFFAPGSAVLTPKGDHLLDVVGDCMKHGALADARVELVGHTDPYGPASRNEVLGYHRAAAAARHLRAQGIAWDRLEIHSEGERHASRQPRLWAGDNRVVIQIDTDSAVEEVVEDLQAAS